ncbi:MAG: hypothetical protein AAGJ35_09825, partial [Myxococcota bacterium]
VTMMMVLSCQSRDEPLVCSAETPKQRFGDALEIPTQSGNYKLFGKGEEFGCVGLKWEGQTGAPPAFVVKFSADGKYQVRNTAGEFVDASLSASVAAGVQKFNVVFLISRENPKDLDCSGYVTRGIAGCFGDDNCLMGWRFSEVEVNGGSGTCSLCSQETCSAKDEDCDGKVDEGACGKVRNTNCTKVGNVDQNTPGCQDDTQECGCLVDEKDQVHVCVSTPGADPKPPLKWTLLSEVTKQCTGDVKILCGESSFFCEKCGETRVWRAAERIGDRCNISNFLQYQP